MPVSATTMHTSLSFKNLNRAVCDKFNDYLYGSKFIISIDNNLLTYVLTTAKLDANSHTWLPALSSYNFSLVYRAGRTLMHLVIYLLQIRKR